MQHNDDFNKKVRDVMAKATKLHDEGDLLACLDPQNDLLGEIVDQMELRGLVEAAKAVKNLNMAYNIYVDRELASEESEDAYDDIDDKEFNEKIMAMMDGRKALALSERTENLRELQNEIIKEIIGRLRAKGLTSPAKAISMLNNSYNSLVSELKRWAANGSN
jgi:hypothetical protein